LVDPKSIPYDPPVQVLQDFNNLFTDADSVQRQLARPSIVPPSTVRIDAWTDDAARRGRNMMLFSEFDSELLEHMKTCISQYGLTAWCPDLRQSPSSLYNMAHRLAALESFKQGLIANAYHPFNAGRQWASRTEDLTTFYNHHVHYFLLERYKVEKRSPGATKVRDARNTKAQSRGRVRLLSLNFLLQTNFLQ
jgi:hypothetical protein